MGSEAMEIIEVKLKKLSEMKSCKQARIWFQKIFWGLLHWQKVSFSMVAPRVKL